DEAEIRGHRRTYIGALPGQVIQGLRRAESKNPVFILDEIDKLGSDFRGDPSSALLEVLDPEQNNTFRDHYLDVPFDLSEVLFITTANILDPVPPALRDRMEVLELAGYTEEEKLKIVTDHLVDKQVKNHGLTADYIRFTADALRQVIRGYTREAGVRNLEREIGSLCRKVARRRAEGNESPIEITPEVVVEMLGAPKFLDEEMEERTKDPGVAIGLAWTPTGGEVLFVEASRMAGTGSLTLTGQLGDVMKESARAALSWLRNQGKSACGAARRHPRSDPAAPEREERQGRSDRRAASGHAGPPRVDDRRGVRAGARAHVVRHEAHSESRPAHRAGRRSIELTAAASVKVVYSARYHIDIGPHVFPTLKYRLVYDAIRGRESFFQNDSRPRFVEPEAASWDELALVHT